MLTVGQPRSRSMCGPWKDWARTAPVTVWPMSWIRDKLAAMQRPVSETGEVTNPGVREGGPELYLSHQD